MTIGIPSRLGPRFALLVAVGMLGASCTSGSDAFEPIPTVETTATVTTAETTTTVASDPEEDTSLDQLTEVWIQAWAAAAAAEEDKTDLLERVANTLSPEVMAELEDEFQGEVERQITNHPVYAENADGTVTINDCLYVRPSAVGGTTNWYEATATPTDAGWTVNTVSRVSVAGCVPKIVADEVIADYLEFRSIRDEYWNPAQPDHPGVAETMTGEHLTYIVDLLQQDQESGWVLETAGTEYNPEIFAVQSPTRIVVSDCSVPGPERGFYDSSGKRQEGIDAIVPDQRDIDEATMILEDGQWKVESLAGQPNVGCQPAPSVNGLAQV